MFTLRELGVRVPDGNQCDGLPPVVHSCVRAILAQQKPVCCLEFLAFDWLVCRMSVLVWDPVVNAIDNIPMINRCCKRNSNFPIENNC